LAAAIADQAARAGGEFVALGMAAEIVVIVKNENARARPDCLAIKPCGGEPADATANDDQIIRLDRPDRHVIDAEAPTFAREGMRDFERAGMLTPEPGQCWRIGGRRGGDLRGGREAGADCQSGTAEKVAACDGRHAENLPSVIRR